MKAIFEVEFDSRMMMTSKDLKKYYKNSWVKAIKYLYKQDGLGIFAKELKLIGVKQ